ncbi:uncharacterized protein LOC142974779 [Anticarsia gemmatalis]|uniref:uncharacterized protein LOC142974779 n=1 Tax=Anticarsia gemmatalis TaxID=129554 RepID=UPI003F7728E7
MGNKQKPTNKYEIIEKNVFNTIEWQENITVLDLSKREISEFDDNLKLPPNIVDLNLSHNKITEIPTTVLKLEKLIVLDLSHNEIVLFDNTPSFCHSIENLNLSNNKLEGPPYWVWTEKPKQLYHLNLSYNQNICESFEGHYLEELLSHTTLVKEIVINNCRLSRHMKLMSTFRHAKAIDLGCTDYNYHSVNFVENVPCVGLDKCHDVERLNLCNTRLYNIQQNIDIYQNLIEINLSDNNICSIPNEFCNLKNLEICILSFNRILYLPDDFHKLERLTRLHLDSNKLCMLPENFKLKNLKTLDLYNNHLYEGFDDLKTLKQYDFAQNYGDEPCNEEYLEMKLKLRENCTDTDRLDGRAPETVNPDRERSCSSSDDFFYLDAHVADEKQEPAPAGDTRCSTPEDWDSDDFWIPSPIDHSKPSLPLIRRTSPSTTQYSIHWLEFVKKKMSEGSFCPMDMHLTISITEQVKYEKMCNQQPVYESDGQFDDFSDDDT